MFVFTLDGALFRLSVKTPSFAPLFQLPPRMKPLNQTLSLPQSAGSNLVFKETALRVLRILTATLYPPAKHFPNLVYLTNGKLILSYGKKFHIFGQPYNDS